MTTDEATDASDLTIPQFVAWVRRTSPGPGDILFVRTRPDDAHTAEEISDFIGKALAQAGVLPLTVITSPDPASLPDDLRILSDAEMEALGWIRSEYAHEPPDPERNERDPRDPRDA